MSLHTKLFAYSCFALAFLTSTIVAFDLPTLLDFTGTQVEALRSTFLVVPFLGLAAAACFGADLITGEGRE